MITNPLQGQGLFMQIVEIVSDRIIAGIYVPDERIPSVRDLAMEMEVNPQTAMRAVERLQLSELIYNKRGMGYFVSPDAPMRIHRKRQDRFLTEILPLIFGEMNLLGITIDNVVSAYNAYTEKNEESKQADQSISR